MLYGPSICWFWSLSPHRFRPMDIIAQALDGILSCWWRSATLCSLLRLPLTHLKIHSCHRDGDSKPALFQGSDSRRNPRSYSCRHCTSYKLIHPQERVQRMVARMGVEGSGGETVFNHLSDISGTARGRKDSGPLQHISRGKGQGVRRESHNREA